MADRGDMTRRPSRAPVQSRSRRRWAAAACLAGLWMFLLADTGSLAAGTALLLLLAVFVTLCTVALRGLGVTLEHPWVQQAAGVFAHARDGSTQLEQQAAWTRATEPLTVAERVAVPRLRLVTRGSVAETGRSGACAGRGGAADLRLPDEPTVSRVHAKFTFAEGQWWITSLGRNGVTVNGTFLAAEHALRDGDSIRWGSRPDALASTVEIG
jgi:hypothetical protein